MSSSSPMTKTIPIGVAISDPFYRYQMVAPVLQYKRRKNKTVIVNLVQIGKDLNRSPQELIKYLGHAVSSAGSFSSKSGEYLMNGTHSQETIQEKIQEYCDTFVVCGLCQNPETQYRVKRDAIFLECAACGVKTAVDPGHKLCTYILTQHKLPRQTKRNKKKDSCRQKMNKASSESQAETCSRCTGKAASASTPSATNKPSRKKRPQTDTSTPRHGDYEEEFENPYFSTKGNPLYVGCFDRIAKATQVDETKAIERASRRVRKALAKNPNATPVEIVSIVASEQEAAQVLFSRDEIRIFVKAIFHGEWNLMDTLVKYAEVLVLLTDSDRSLEHHLIVVLEEACRNDSSLFCRALEVLYDLDILQEETVLEWSREEKQSKNERLVSKLEHDELKAGAAPFLRWLKEEEEEDD